MGGIGGLASTIFVARALPRAASRFFSTLVPRQENPAHWSRLGCSVGQTIVFCGLPPGPFFGGNDENEWK